ncbi:MAG: carbamoyltransferase HypF [Gemmatimonadota bacterium]
MPTEAIRIAVRGIVQGVGFRPFVYRVAVRCGVSGFVTNTPGSVVVHVEGPRAAIARFRALFRQEMPPAARVTGISARRVRAERLGDFRILESVRTGPALSTIPPDIALCAACRRELSDPDDRRYRYPFINCTNCGPRFTIVRTLPYDRENTSMSAFALCAACRKEYGDPLDRRFHAEPNACPKCGPRLAVADRAGRREATRDPVGRAAKALLSGEIVAIRGLGGFHLAVDATNDESVRKLRERKHREEKPFAVMVPDLATARRIARIAAADEAILSSPSAPVLLVPARPGSPLAPSVAPGLAQVGLFLPYTPLHRLLLDRAGRPLVMTSGNMTDEPIATGNDEALARLSGIADRFLVHDREIVQRSDDSVVRRVAGAVYPIRRARGFVPAPVVVPARERAGGVPRGSATPGAARRGAARPAAVAGLGAELKSTFCILKDGHGYLSQHLGDLDQPPVRDFYADTFAFFREFLDADLAAVCRDLHPAYFTTGFAETVPARRVLSLQHHKAHLFALLAESGFDGRAVGVSFDGTGYGEDGTIWGGEIFAVHGMEMTRAASLRPFPLQGGDSAVKEPWKSALGLLCGAFGPAEARAVAAELFPEIDASRLGLVIDAIDRGVNVVATSSCGRLFDAASALAGVCRKASYEGQPAMLLEGCAGRRPGNGPYGFEIRNLDGRLGIDWRETVAGIVADVRGGVPPAAVARRFHDTVAAMILRAAEAVAEGSGARHVLLSGGVFQNVRLLTALLAGFRARKLAVIVHRQVPANDGGISLGQAYYAAQTIAGG